MSRFAGIAALVLAVMAVLPARTLALQTAGKAVSETPKWSSDDALDAAARRFRLQVYETYRSDRAEYERRRMAGDQVQARWRQAGKRPEDARAIIHWFDEAAYRSRSEVRGSLPDMPVFGPLSAHNKPQEPRTTRPAQAITKRPTGPTPVAEPHPSRSSQIAPRLPATFTPTAPSEIASPPSNPQSLSAGPDRAPPYDFGVLSPPEKVESPARLRGIARPLGATVGNAPAIETPRASTARGILRPSVQNLSSGRAIPNHPSAPEIDQGPLNRDTPFSAPNPRSAHARPNAPATAPPHRVALAKPSLGGVDRSVPELVATPSATASRDEVTTDFNVGELLARASGYSVGLRTVDSVLHERDELSTDDLAKLLAELELLLNQRRDLLLYDQLVGDADRARLVAILTFPQNTVAGLGTRIAKARQRLAGRSGDDSAAPSSELQMLEELSLRLSRAVQD